jgi:hypothetical protein
MSTPPYSWPEELFPADQVRTWLSVELGADTEGPIEVLYTKQWGTTALFGCADGSTVVFKGSRHPAAAHGPVVHQFLAEVAPEAVPPVIAARVEADTAWTVFEPLMGEPLEARLSPVGFERLAATLASIQIRASERPIPAPVPRSPLDSLPHTLDRFQNAVTTHLAGWEAEGSGPNRASVEHTPELLAGLRLQVELVAERVAGSRWPDSIDHVDLNVSNAVVEDGHLVIFDWEEAVVGFPPCSLDRLLDDAREFDGWETGFSPTCEAVIEAYAAAVPWGTPDTRRRLIEEGLRLNRIAFAGQALDFWQARGHPFGHPKLMAVCVDRILEAWT